MNEKKTGEPDYLRKKLKFVAQLTERLRPENVAPILVGGTALEFYTFGGYESMDVDLVISGRERAARVLEEEFGFQREGRHWYNEDLDIAIEIPDHVLAGSREKVVPVIVEGKVLYVIGVEDLIVDRLAAAKFWKVEADAEWAAALLTLHGDKIDWEYLRKRAQEENVVDFLERAVNLEQPRGFNSKPPKGMKP